MTKQKPKFTPPPRPHFLPSDKITKAYALERKNNYEWAIVEITISDDKVIHVNKDVHSMKEIKAQKLIDILMSGEPLNEVV